ncbi:DUF262 domain-containing protein [Candidatus Woesearchaeota archaeon]|nr:DUF262 domain-containing protein [Candidatus Woesearchaeota archaeon]MBT7402384.1 DUF262 domain-containing protein [Candidatus Woesearchaeota archaeon]
MEIKTVSCKREGFEIEELYKMWKDGKIIFNTEYQRSEVWLKPKKQKLIDSILRKYDINKIFFRITKDQIYECLDGQQRLRSIFNFMDGNFPTSNKYTPEIGEILFTDLPEKFKWAIRSYRIDAVAILWADDEVTSDIFLRLQEGVPLNSAERLNAMRGEARNLIAKELSQINFLKICGIKEHRFSHRHLCAQMLLLEVHKVSETQFIDCKYRNLQLMYEKYKNRQVPNRAVSDLKKALNYLEKSLGEKYSRFINKKGDIIAIYLLTSYLLKHYSMLNHEKEYKKFIIDFLKNVRNINTKNTKETQSNKYYYTYKMESRTSADSAASMKKRFEILIKKFLEFCPTIKKKDNQRIFDEYQQLVIYERADGICQNCNKKIILDDSEFDHIISHSKGGHTTIENGQLLCIKCNRRKSNK